MNDGTIVTMVQGGTPKLDEEIMKTHINGFKFEMCDTLSDLREYGTGVEYEIVVYVEYRKKEVVGNGR